MPIRHVAPASGVEQLRSGLDVPSLADAARTPSDDDDFWFQTVQQLLAREAVTAMARELALQSQLIGRDTDHWLLRVEKESLNHGASRERLQNALAEAGHAVRLGVEIGRVTIDPSLLADDKDMLEDLVAAAFNAAVRKAEDTSQEKMGKLTAGMPSLPGGMKFPF